MTYRGYGEFHFSIEADSLDQAREKFHVWMARIEDEAFLAEHHIEIDDFDAGVHDPIIFDKR